MTTDRQRFRVLSHVGLVARLGRAERRHETLENDMRHAGIGAAFLLTLLPLGALAQSTTPPSAPATQAAVPAPAIKQARAKMRAACAVDVQKFCADVERGKGALRGCLRSHRSELSAECKSARMDLRAVGAAERAKEKG